MILLTIFILLCKFHNRSNLTLTYIWQFEKNLIQLVNVSKNLDAYMTFKLCHNSAKKTCKIKI